MPSFLLFLLTLLSLEIPRAHASGKLCLDLFQKRFSHVVVRTADQVFTTQSAIGRTYAEVKLLGKSGLGKYKRISAIKGKDLRSLKDFVDSTLRVPLPAVVSPRGEIFIIDGHHNLYDAVLLGYKLKTVKVSLEIVKDYRADEFTEDQFHQDLIEREWADLVSVQKTPKLISELKDSSERSLAGLSFLYIAKTFAVSMTGKHFVPRVQFKLVDLAKREDLFDFDANLAATLDDSHIESFAYLILTNPKILSFLRSSLLPSASASLAKFLFEKHQEASANLAPETPQ